MEALKWEDVPESSVSLEQGASSFKASMATRWFGATVLLVAIIVGFIVGKFIY